MLKFFHLFRHYFIGLSLVGLLAFVLQEIPYIVMPMIKLTSNPIMNLPNELPWIERAQGISGTLTMLLLMLLVRDDARLFPLSAPSGRMFFALTALMLLLNYAGWTFYFLGLQFGRLIVVSQFAAVPLYYLFFGLWSRNYPLAVSAAAFFIVHTANGCLNFLI